MYAITLRCLLDHVGEGSAGPAELRADQDQCGNRNESGAIGGLILEPEWIVSLNRIHRPSGRSPRRSRPGPLPAGSVGSAAGRARPVQLPAPLLVRAPVVGRHRKAVARHVAVTRPPGHLGTRRPEPSQTRCSRSGSGQCRIRVAWRTRHLSGGSMWRAWALPLNFYNERDGTFQRLPND